MVKHQKKATGLLGGSFDPPHKGHLKISKISIKKIGLKKIYWVVTKKNPFKEESENSVSKRIKDCKKMLWNDNVLYALFLMQIGKTPPLGCCGAIKYFQPLLPSCKDQSCKVSWPT